MSDEQSSEKVHSGGERALNCRFFVSIPAQIGGFVHKKEGENLHKRADMCMVALWMKFFTDAFYCQFSLQVFSTEIIHDS